MTIQQWIIFGTLFFTLILFITGRWRYDLVALFALLTVTLTGLIPPGSAFSGFSNPAVITVAAVLVISRALQNSGVVDLLGDWLLQLKGGITIQLAAMTGIVAVLSAFMNNVGALALLLPVTLQIARKKSIPASSLLMPLAFASLLGGMTTLIGTPPNIIAASFREQAGGTPFVMFDFSPVGVGVALAGLLFIVLVGWRLVPVRRSGTSSEALFDIEKYVTEVRIPADSKLNGKRLLEIGQFTDNGVNVIGLVRAGERRFGPAPQTKFLEGDILILETDTGDLESLLAKANLKLVGSEKIVRKDLESDEITLIEAVITSNSMMVGKTAYSLKLRNQYGVNLLAISRQDKSLWARLDRIRFQQGDALLLQSHLSTTRTVLANLGLLPLAQRGLRIGHKHRILPALVIFGAALVLAAIGVVPAPIALVTAAVVMVVTNFISLRAAYQSVDWPIIILLGAMIPVGEALETTGGAQLIANSLLLLAGQIPPAFILIAILIGTMFLSDLINNAAAVVLMAPIGISVSQTLGVSVDPFLMAIAIGASCAFLTPIGHQSNTLVMSPGGYRFGDYWRMGLLLELIVVLTAIPLLLIFWPL